MVRQQFEQLNQPAAWQQLSALGHVDMVTLNVVNMVVWAVAPCVSQTTGPLGFFFFFCCATTALKGLQRMVCSSALKSHSFTQKGVHLHQWSSSGMWWNGKWAEWMHCCQICCNCLMLSRLRNVQHLVKFIGSTAVLNAKRRSDSQAGVCWNGPWWFGAKQAAHHPIYV